MMARKLSFAQGSINRVQSLFKANSQPTEEVSRLNLESATMRTSKQRANTTFEETLLEAISPTTKASNDVLPVTYDHTSDKSLV